MNEHPMQAPCDHCQQTRPLFLYWVEHGHYQAPHEAACRFCSRDPQPLLCVRCFDSERAREESDPGLLAEHAALERICAANCRYVEKQEQQ